MSSGSWVIKLENIVGQVQFNDCLVKIKAEYISATEKTSSETGIKLYSNLSNNFNPIKIPVSTSEYYILENREITSTGYFTEGGVLITHV